LDAVLPKNSSRQAGANRWWKRWRTICKRSFPECRASAHVIYSFAFRFNITAKKEVLKYNKMTQSDFVNYLEEEEIQIFEVQSLKNRLDLGNRTINEIVENLTSIGFLSRVERGKYCRANFRDENVIGTFLAKDSAIAYWSALNLHGLTEQFPNKIFIQTIQLKKEAEFAGTTYQFIKIQPSKRTGIVFNGYGNYKYPITDIEKTIVDCFDLPQYSGGFAELIRAFCNAKLNAKKLMDYSSAVDNIAAIKRLGFLAELFEKRNLSSFVRFAKSKVNRSYNLFDTFGENSGKPNNDWYLRMNLSKENILGIAQNQY
jgi:predicted transcriptional regulator of viral defense system